MQAKSGGKVVDGRGSSSKTSTTSIRTLAALSMNVNLVMIVRNAIPLNEP
jgi:hypothetical protein